uniref:Uncharacterized protein n=1 Tax=Agrobacterium albertimagni TaxID=147266 RepID=A0A7C1SWX5_9HYPH
MNDLYAVILWLASLLETDSDGRLDLHSFQPEIDDTASGAIVSVASGQLIMLEGEAAQLNALIAKLECRHNAKFKLLGHRFIGARSRLPLIVNPARLLPAEDEWINQALGPASVNPVELEMLLRWAGHRQMEIALGTLGETAWRHAPVFPFRSSRASTANLL